MPEELSPTITGWPQLLAELDLAELEPLLANEPLTLAIEAAASQRTHATRALAPKH